MIGLANLTPEQRAALGRLQDTALAAKSGATWACEITVREIDRARTHGKDET
jgi:hypothetical protein